MYNLSIGSVEISFCFLHEHKARRTKTTMQYKSFISSKIFNLYYSHKITILFSHLIFYKLSKFAKDKIHFDSFAHCQVLQSQNFSKFFTKLSSFTELKSAENTCTLSSACSQRGGSLAAGGGSTKARTRANDYVTCSVSYESAPPLA